MNSGRVCVSVCEKTAAGLAQKIRLATAYLVELRLDCLELDELDKFSVPEGPFIITLRPETQGGFSTLSVNDRKKFWSAVPDKCGADLEPDIIDNGVSRRFDPLICSFHDFSVRPSDIADLYEVVSRSAAKILKIAGSTSEATDAIVIWQLLDKAKLEGRDIIPIAMGEAGKWTRILGLAHGAYMTYAALSVGSETAPGQISIEDALSVYRVKELDESTEVYGIIAGDTSYSMSPYIHNAAFKAAGRNAVFVPFQVADLDQFMSRMVRIGRREVELNFRGFSVTNPHKQSVLKYLDEIDEAAHKIGAVNTIKIVEGKLHGFNTDAIGFIAPLKSKFGDLTKARVAVVGAGGAARAAMYALKNNDTDVTVFARDAGSGRKLASEFQATFRQIETDNSKLESVFDHFDIVVNATPLGTRGPHEAEAIAKAKQLRNVKLVYDLIYNPAETRLIREAKATGAETLGGFDMLIAQAVEQQKIWTGEPPAAAVMTAAARKRLDER